MEHTHLVTAYLEKQGLLPGLESVEDGITLSLDSQEQVSLAGSPLDLIELADLLVSLALSGENRGQHYHVDDLTLIASDSELQELILLRK